MMRRQETQKNQWNPTGWCLILFLLLLLSVPVFFACAGPEGGDNEENTDDQDQTSSSDFTVTDLKYAVVNMEDGQVYMDDATLGVNSCFWFTVEYNDPDYEELDDDEEQTYEDLTITFTFEGVYSWTVNGDEANVFVFPNSSKITVSNLHPWDGVSNYAHQENVLPLGKLKVSVEWGTDKSDTYTKNIVGPEADDSEYSNLIYSEDVQLPPEGNGVFEMIQRAENINGAIAGEWVNIDFYIPDNRVQNGEIWFFNAAGDVIGVSETFQNTDGGYNSFINQGTGLNYALQPNEVIISTTEIQSLDDETDVVSADDIAQYAIILTDSITMDENFNILDSGNLSITDKINF